MKGLGLDFQKNLKFLFFVNFCMFYSCLNTLKIRIFEKVEKSKICSDFKSNRLFYTFMFSTFSGKSENPDLGDVQIGTTRSKIIFDHEHEGCM